MDNCLSEEEALYIRAKHRALYLIERREYTRKEVRDKLRKSGKYEDSVIHRVLDFLEEYHFVDDKEYAFCYIRTYGEIRSRKQIQYELERKGIDREYIKNALEELEFDDLGSLERLAEKRLRGKELTPKERKKQCTYFMGKGYSYEQIRKVLDNYME